VLSLRFYRLGQWAPVVLLGLLATGLGLFGFLTCDANAACHVNSLGEALVRTLLLIRGSESFAYGQAPFSLVAAQTLMFLTLVLAGLTGSIKLFMHNLRHDVQLARAQTLHEHVVVCGLGETGLEIVRGLKRGGHRVVAITRADADTAIAECDRLGVPVLSGDATRRETLEQAGVARAHALVATTGSDATNLDIVITAGRVAGAAKRMVSTRQKAPVLLRARPEIRAPWLIDAMAVPAETVFDPTLLVHPLRTAEVSARRLLGTASFLRLAGTRPRIVLVGLGDLGTAILRQAALSSFALPGVRADVLCYDREAEACGAILQRAPWGRTLPQCLDLEIKPAHFGSPQAPGRMTDWDSIEADLASHPPDAVIVALGDDDAALEAGFGLRAALDRLRHFATPVHVRTRREHGLSALLGRMAARPLCPDRLVGFGDLASVIGPAPLFDEETDRMARAVHDDFLAAEQEPGAPASLPWEQLAERFRRASRAFADHIPVKLRHAGLRLAPGPDPGAALSEAEIEAMARAEHHRWCLDLLAAGWRFDSIRDEAAKTHPRLVPWEALPAATRAYNLGAAAKIPHIAREVGLTVRRLRRVALASGAPLPPLEPGAIALLEIDVTDEAAWRMAEATAENSMLAIHASGLETASPADLQRIATRFPRAAAAVEAWVDAAPARNSVTPLPSAASAP
jgi:hypothetical protein